MRGAAVIRRTMLALLLVIPGVVFSSQNDENDAAHDRAARQGGVGEPLRRMDMDTWTG
jgi:hypothetical protein